MELREDLQVRVLTVLIHNLPYPDPPLDLHHCSETSPSLINVDVLWFQKPAAQSTSQSRSPESLMSDELCSE
jgi:hypothetical protein